MVYIKPRCFTLHLRLAILYTGVMGTEKKGGVIPVFSSTPSTSSLEARFQQGDTGPRKRKTPKLKGRSVQFLPGSGGEGPGQFHCCAATAAASSKRDALHWDYATAPESYSGARALPGATELSLQQHNFSW